MILYHIDKSAMTSAADTLCYDELKSTVALPVERKRVGIKQTMFRHGIGKAG